MNRATINDNWVQNPDGTLGFTCSIITGCDKRCPWCFAMKNANSRLRSRYLHGRGWKINFDPFRIGYSEACLDPFYPRFWQDRLEKLDRFLASRQKPTGVFLNIMGDGFGDSILADWIDMQLEVARKHPRHRIYFLTHQPQNLMPWSFPDNCYVGFTANDGHEFVRGLDAISDLKARVIFVSIEPMIDWHIPVDILVQDLKAQQVDWLIIGAMTGSHKEIIEMHQRFPELTPMPWLKRWTLQPKIEWVKTIADAADQAEVPLFMKPNLAPLVPPFGNELFPPAIRVRQDMPEPVEAESVDKRQQILGVE